MPSKDRKILVTGATGYIGSHTLVDLIEKGFSPISLDNECNSDASVLDAIYELTSVRVPHYRIDACDAIKLEQVFQKNSIEGIIHFAALKAVGESVEQPIRYFRNNINSLINVLELALKYGVNSFVFSSSCTVYGNPDLIPVTEMTPWKEAESPYGRTKQIGEQIIQDVLRGSSTKAVILRYFNPAGAHVSAKMGESPVNPAMNLVPVITETAIGIRESLTIFGADYNTRDGTCIRDYVHVQDLAAAHTLALQKSLNDEWSCQINIFNLGCGEGYTVRELVDAFMRVNKVSLTYKFGPRRPGDVVAIYADNTKAQRELGWKPKYGIEDIMKSAWEWEKNRRKKD